MARFKLQVSTIANNILAFKKEMWFDCNRVVALGPQVVRMYIDNQCIQAIKVYRFEYAGVLYGIEDVESLGEFLDIRDRNCMPFIIDEECFITYDDVRICY